MSKQTPPDDQLPRPDKRIDRRQFVRKGGVLLVATVSCTSEGVRTEPTARGTIRLTLTGTHSSAEHGGTATATASGGGQPVTVILPLSGETVVVVPVGTYSVSYEPPDNHQLAAGITIPPVVQILEGQTTTIAVGLVVTGTLNVTVSGLTGTAGGSAVAQRTDAAGPPIPISVSAAGAGSADDVTVGTYTVTYTAPAGFSVSTTNPLTGVAVGPAAAASATFTVIAASASDGALQVTVNGLSGATVGGSVSARLSNNTGATFTGIVSPPVSGSGSVTLSGMPPGAYNVSYTPPSGFELAAGQTNPQVVTVATAATANATFSAQALPAAPGNIQVSVSGLTGASAGGSVSAQLTNGTGAVFAVTLSVPASGQSSGTLQALPPGSYNVTYTPPAGYQLASGQVNPRQLLVTSSATANTSFVAQAIPVPADGSIQVSISGLVGASAGGTVTARLTNNTGSTFGGVLPVPVSGATSVTLTAMPAGSYNVTYTPPSGYELAAGQTATHVVDVPQSGQASTSYVAQQTAPAVGAVQVTVTGLTGAPDGGSVTARLTNNTGSTFSANLSAPASGSSTATLNNLPTGSYNVTYAPPAGYQLAAGQTNPHVVVVSSGATASTSWTSQQIPAPGSVLVSVTGLTGATAGGSVSARLTDNTGSTFNGNLPAPTGDTSAVTLSGMPPGSYNATYTPPAGFQLANGQTNPHVVAVTSGGTANTAWVSQAIPAPQGLVFASDWRTATGNSASALSDGGKWDDVSSGTNRVSVIAATGLDFPSGMTNVLAGRYRNTDTAFWIVGITNGWQLPPVGGVMCKRLYFRHTVVGSSSITYHPVEPAVGNCADEGEWVVNSQANFIFRLQTHSHRWETTLQRGQTYRVEERWERTGTQTWILHMRVYDSAGNLIRQDADFNCSLGHGNHNLATGGSTVINTTGNADCLRSQNINWQGSAQDGRGSDDENNNRIYYGGYALSMSDWCGPFTPSEIP